MSHPTTAITPHNVTKALEMAAAGQTQPAIAQALGISVRSVTRMLSEPLAKQRLAELRLAVRVKTLAGCKAIAPPALDWARDLAEKKDNPKGFDQVARGLANLERAASSASGEALAAREAPHQTLNVLIAPWALGQAPPVHPAPVPQVKVLKAWTPEAMD
jgi:hypothetical protein